MRGAGAATVKAALDNLAMMAVGQRAGHALELADRSLARITRARDRMGDASDVCDDLLKQVRNIYIIGAFGAASRTG